MKGRSRPLQPPSNSGLAKPARPLIRPCYGDWRELFRRSDAIDKVTAADIRRVAGTLCSSRTNRTVGKIETDRKERRRKKGAEMKTPQYSRARHASWCRRWLRPGDGSQGDQDAAAARASIPRSPSVSRCPTGLVIFLQEDKELPLVRGAARSAADRATCRRRRPACSASTPRRSANGRHRVADRRPAR